ncbi:hypothetical protein DFJ58DRAFT_725191 [Suillus subalutaceus]|uniref:uncharacterized protein n=1 Tax=Suillus subalutaceus TaxID=48586 RepID=UPI001B86C8E4|nr:uncharacterized protein DFJ58DRAFT_734151 [Suillus subalutaceus]XP_041246755.1 uncharacterized protein DFJ58DRAFT_725191 [Suillus subalutaceus]KAG1837860.1 hypothetical protein DFJ58DRAFT_734151 [Suillus subalutaceus]KAG1863288.1 hypothetical protein DFJ58DRAFT_725191 [Suillus subalutaceus]
MPNSKGSAKQPVCLCIEELAQEVKDSLISLPLSLESQKTQIFLVSGTEKQKVPRECHDAVSVLVHQFQLYRGSVIALMALPESDGVKEDIDFHLAITLYLTDILARFMMSLERMLLVHVPSGGHATLTFTSQWLWPTTRSQRSNRPLHSRRSITWNDFQQKKIYAPVQQLDLAKMHDAFCKDGVNVIEPHTAHKPAEAKEIQQKKNLRFEDITLTDVNTSPVGEVRKTRKDSCNVNTQGPTAADKAKRARKPNRSENDSDEVQNIYELQESTKKPRNKSLVRARNKKTVMPEMMIQPENENCSDMEELFWEWQRIPLKPRNEKVKSKSKSEETLESEVQRDASDDSDLEDDGIQEVAKTIEGDGKQTHKSAKRRRNRKTATKDKKAKSKEMIESEDERHCDLDMTVASESDADAGEYDHEGNSHVFLKLAAWISRRFCELAGIDKDDDLNGLVIPKHPGWFVFDSHDHFLEALGMERMYAATTHMDTHPEYLTCVFRQLVASMMSAHELPWLLPLVPSTDDTDSESDGDECDINVTHACVIGWTSPERVIQWIIAKGMVRWSLYWLQSVKRGPRPTSPAVTSTTASISSSVSDITKALLLEESFGSTNEPADTGVAVTDTDGDVSTNEPPETEEAIVDIVEGAAGSLSEPVHGSGFKAGSERMSPETAAADADVEASQLISDSDTTSASNPGHPSKKDEDVIQLTILVSIHAPATLLYCDLQMAAEQARLVSERKAHEEHAARLGNALRGIKDAGFGSLSEFLVEMMQRPISNTGSYLTHFGIRSRQPRITDSWATSTASRLLINVGKKLAAFLHPPSGQEVSELLSSWPLERILVEAEKLALTVCTFLRHINMDFASHQNGETETLSVVVTVICMLAQARNEQSNGYQTMISCTSTPHPPNRIHLSDERAQLSAPQTTFPLANENPQPTLTSLAKGKQPERSSSIPSRKNCGTDRDALDSALLENPYDSDLFRATETIPVDDVDDADEDEDSDVDFRREPDDAMPTSSNVPLMRFVPRSSMPIWLSRLVMQLFGRVCGVKSFDGLHTTVNEYSEIVSIVITQNKGHEQIGPVLRAVVAAAKMFGHTPTEAVYTDSASRPARIPAMVPFPPSERGPCPQ